MHLVYSHYDKESGKSTVLMEHEGTQYMGNAYFNKKEEKQPSSSYFGLRIAEKRAIIEYYRERKNINRVKAQAIESFLKDLDNTTFTYVDNPIVKKIKQHCRYYKQEVVNYQTAIENMRSEIKKDIKTRQLIKEIKRIK